MDMETLVRQALARGYCHPDNSDKELDAKLIEAMTQEVVKALTPETVPGQVYRGPDTPNAFHRRMKPRLVTDTP